MLPFAKVNKSGEGGDRMAVNAPVRSQKRTFSLHDSVIRAIDEMVESGFASSKNALVEGAIWERFQQFRRAKRSERWKMASVDKTFLKDITEVEQQFQTADRETLGQVS